LKTSPNSGNVSALNAPPVITTTKEKPEIRTAFSQLATVLALFASIAFFMTGEKTVD
jgi:hypothetical protein